MVTGMRWSGWFVCYTFADGVLVIMQFNSVKLKCLKTILKIFMLISDLEGLSLIVWLLPCSSYVQLYQ